MFKVRNSIVAIGLSLASSVIYADTLSAGAAYGGPAQTQAVCYLYNSGTGPVSVTSRAIFREPNVALPFTFNGCGATLAAGSSCGVAANIVNNLAHSCRFVVSPSGADVRGTLEFRSAQGAVLNNVELR